MDDRIEVWQGDITTLQVDAIVNAANNPLAGGSGVDGAIHRAAGHDLLQAACRRIGYCATGQAVVTPGFNLSSRFIFHTVGPVWRSGDAGEPDLLRSCYRACMTLAAQEDVQSIAFPAISCGVYGYPAEAAVVIAVDEVAQCLARFPGIGRVVFVCFDAAMTGLYRAALANC